MASSSPTRVGYFERLRLLAMLGVIACPITSGDTAFRDMRRAG